MTKTKFPDSEYYRKLHRDAEAFAIDVGDSEWYDFWHTHVDWKGEGNKTPKDRREHLLALFTVFSRVRVQAGQLEKEYQTWIIVDPKDSSQDSSQDSVYLHTDNPNETPFPYAFETVNWEAEAPSYLREFLADDLQFGVSNEEGVELLWVRGADAR